MRTVRYDGATPGARAVQVFGECVAAGYVLGGAAASLAVCVAGVLHHDTGVGVVLVFALIAGGVGGGIGLMVGFLVGGVLIPVVRWGEKYAGRAAIARLIPFVALVVTLPVAVTVGLLGDTEWFVGLLVIDVMLTLAGATCIAHRYLRRAEVAHVH